MSPGRVTGSLLTLTALVGLAGAALLGAGARDSVDWSGQRAVVFESDDWGLAGFVPADSAWHGVDREALAPGRFPAVYWGSTLEDSAAVAELAAVLERAVGRDGLPAVLQPNYVMSSLQLEDDDHWRRYDLPAFPPVYARPGMWGAVRDALGRGVWYPEFHAAWHYDPDRRREQTEGAPEVAAAARRGIMLFPGSERARELGAWRSTEALTSELEAALDLFRGVFGRRPGSIIAPDYAWNSRNEDIWQGRGLTVIQAKREQRNPGFGVGTAYRIRKWADRQYARAFRPDRIYLERNCRFEPVQYPDPDAVVRSCLSEIATAWERGEPAVVETHRINFVHTDPSVAAAGRAALAGLLQALTDGSRERPVFLTDHELAQLKRRGASWCVRGGEIVVRNASCSSRVVIVPGHALDLAAQLGGRGERGQAPVAVSVPAGAMGKLVPGRGFVPVGSRR
jgi:hypothetical protein